MNYYDTHPDVAILMVWFPVSACVTVEQPIACCPIRAAISTLRSDGCDLFSAS